MDGNGGPEWPWCAGFVSFIVKQACRTLDVARSSETSVSCDVLAGQATQKEIFVSEPKAKDRSLLTPGSLFLVRRTETDWTHTGIVLKADNDVFYTIEGNTNDDGSREGYEVCRRIRGYAKKDFIVI